MFKNLTSKQIAFYCSVILSTFLLVPLLIGQYFSYLSLNNSGWAILFIFYCLISYFIILYFVNRYIYRRIKLIYKIIHDNKVSLSKEKEDIKDIMSTGLNDVGQEVTEYVMQQQHTIDNLKTMETYRRDFIGNVSHELKTPIFNIQGYIHTLIDGAVEDENLSKKYLDRAAWNVDRLQTIVENLETISKLELGELILEMTKFDIKKLTDEVFEEIELQASDKEIKLIYKDGAAYNFSVIADREYIRQVLVNLLTNSVKYGKQGGISKVSFYDMDHYVLVEISDDGIGIDKSHLKHVFDRFYRVDKSRNRTVGGSGLGLSIVKHIIEAHNQTINVRSTLGAGSTFGFTIEKAKTK